MVWTGSGGLQRCWTGEISWSIQLQQETTGVDLEQTWAQTQASVKPGRDRIIIHQCPRDKTNAMKA